MVSTFLLIMGGFKDQQLGDTKPVGGPTQCGPCRSPPPFPSPPSTLIQLGSPLVSKRNEQKKRKKNKNIVALRRSRSVEGPCSPYFEFYKKKKKNRIFFIFQNAYSFKKENYEVLCFFPQKRLMNFLILNKISQSFKFYENS